MFVESRSDTGESEAEAEEAEPRREAATNTRVPDSPGQEMVQRSVPSLIPAGTSGQVHPSSLERVIPQHRGDDILPATCCRKPRLFMTRLTLLIINTVAEVRPAQTNRQAD